MKVVELKVACKDRGLGVSGRKADLVERLNTCENSCECCIVLMCVVVLRYHYFEHNLCS